MSIFDWLQIALGFIRVVRRVIARTALLFPWKPHPGCTTSAETLESRSDLRS